MIIGYKNKIYRFVFDLYKNSYRFFKENKNIGEK
jgi:hypothetical protein